MTKFQSKSTSLCWHKPILREQLRQQGKSFRKEWVQRRRQGRRKHCTAHRAMVTEGSGDGVCLERRSILGELRGGQSGYRPWEKRGDFYGRWEDLEAKRIVATGDVWSRKFSLKRGEEGERTNCSQRQEKKKLCLHHSLWARISISFSGTGNLKRFSHMNFWWKIKLKSAYAAIGIWSEKLRLAYFSLESKYQYQFENPQYWKPGTLDWTDTWKVIWSLLWPWSCTICWKSFQRKETIHSCPKAPSRASAQGPRFPKPVSLVTV